MRKIIEFSEHYKSNDPPEIEKPLSKNSLKDLVDPWDEQFINLPNQEELLELLLAANYLDIKSLIELCCAKVATMIKGTPLHIQENPQKKSGSSSASSTTSPQSRRRRSERRTSGQKSAPIDQTYHVITLL